MAVSYAMLLDGGFIRRKLGTKKTPANAAAISAFASSIQKLPCLGQMRLHRIYYYDARPLEGIATRPLGAVLWTLAQRKLLRETRAPKRLF